MDAVVSEDERRMETKAREREEETRVDGFWFDRESVRFDGGRSAFAGGMFCSEQG